MENDKLLISEQLSLTKHCFDKLVIAIINKFKAKYNTKTINDSQLFGFGSYNEIKPNLKSEFEELSIGYVNGKYLYNKNRELKQGSPIIKLNREYKQLFFSYLGYDSVESFLENEVLDKLELEKQFSLIQASHSNEDYYYCAYYFGEDQKMTKGKLIIYNNWSNVELRFVYFDEKDVKSEYIFYGVIKISEDFMFIHTKYIANNTKKEGANFTFFIGKSTPAERNYLIGTYSGFDKYNRAIAGKMILEKFADKKAMESEFATRYVDPLLTQELRRERIIVESHVPNHSSKISNKSPYASLFSKLSGNYYFSFYDNGEKKLYSLELSIDPHNYKILSNNLNLIIENDIVKLINRGQNVYLDFEVNGVSYLQKISMYIKMYYLMNFENEVFGVYSGIDLNNNPINGKVKIEIRE
ncbi:hypothetical protein [Gillisia sp. CAL575]|uniref:hypothetical protein n=1 Tax=Gillisia sp. CAL575 TaxID=985255 RepID=UPI0003A01CBA|nr:hypothetical protein [Gillisia sp. CAL575]